MMPEGLVLQASLSCPLVQLEGFSTILHSFFPLEEQSYRIGTGRKIAYLFPSQNYKKRQSIAYIGFNCKTRLEKTL